ncbi:MAG: formimidoylglutamate deiminase [Myxococcota bacterium]
MWLRAARAVLDGGRIERQVALRVDIDGRIAEIEVESTRPVDRDFDSALLTPGAVNAHSHAFQRALRGRTQRAENPRESFWSWREQMYRLVAGLDPSSLYAVSRQMFLEMLLSGTTSVGEFHYVHHGPDGRPYADRDAMAKAVIEAARSVGLRIALLRVIYLRGDFESDPEPAQRRFCDSSLEVALEAIHGLREYARRMNDPRVVIGASAHSVRAVPIDAIVGAKTRLGDVPFHLHVSEQPREVDGCIAAYGMPPVKLLDEYAVLDGQTCLVHATHLREGEIDRIASTGATVCFCPSTEADLGDGKGPSRALVAAQVPIALGTDGQTLSSVWEEARRLEMHERLAGLERIVLGREPAKLCWEAATARGARAVGIAAGELRVGRFADFSLFDLDTPELVGCDDESLLAALVFSSPPRARDVVVGGRSVVRDGDHPLSDEIRRDYQEALDRIFS